MKEKRQDPLGTLRTQIQELITESYPTVEQFCWDKDVAKSTVSNFLNADRDPRFSTIEKLAEALGKKVVIRLE